MKLRTALAASAIFAATPSEAATYLITYSGTANIQQDDYGYFGGLIGSHAYQATYVVDDALGTISTSPTTSVVFGGVYVGVPNPLTGSLTISGARIDLGDPLTRDSVQFLYNDYDDGSGMLFDQIGHIINQIASYDPATDVWPAAGLVDTEIGCFHLSEVHNAKKEVQPRVQA